MPNDTTEDVDVDVEVTEFPVEGEGTEATSPQYAKKPFERTGRYAEQSGELEPGADSAETPDVDAGDGGGGGGAPVDTSGSAVPAPGDVTTVPGATS